jgi:hypothetical protein
VPDDHTEHHETRQQSDDLLEDNPPLIAETAEEREMILQLRAQKAEEARFAALREAEEARIRALWTQALDTAAALCEQTNDEDVDLWDTVGHMLFWATKEHLPADADDLLAGLLRAAGYKCERRRLDGLLRRVWLKRSC